MTDHDTSLLRSMLAESRGDRFAPGFADRVIERIVAEDAAPAPLIVHLWPPFRRLVAAAVAASLVMAVYATTAGTTAQSPLASAATLDEIYGLNTLQP